MVLITDAIVERLPIIPDQPQGGRQELARPWAGTDSGHLREQLRSSPAAVVTPEYIVTVLPEVSRYNCIMKKSSLFFSVGDFCPSVNEHRDNLTELHHLAKFQGSVKRMLKEGLKRTNHRHKPG